MDKWNIMFERLVEYKRKHGNTAVPRDYRDNEDEETVKICGNSSNTNASNTSSTTNNVAKLGTWVSAQRQQYSRVRRGLRGGALISQHRIDLLDGIGFEWSIKRGPRVEDNAGWNKMFDRLVQYKQRYGHVLVPRHYNDDNDNNDHNDQNITDPNSAAEDHGDNNTSNKSVLGEWVSHQRIMLQPELKKLQRKKDNKEVNPTVVAGNDNDVDGDDDDDDALPKWKLERIEKLNSIGFCWCVRDILDGSWDTMYRHLVDYKRVHGHTNVPQKYVVYKNNNEEIDEERISKSKGSKGGKGSGNNNSVKLGKWVHHQRTLLCKKQQQNQVEQSSSSSSSPLSKSSSSSRPGGQSLSSSSSRIIGGETERQRHSRLKQEERIHKLDLIGFCWSIRPSRKQQQQQSSQSKQQQSKHRKLKGGEGKSASGPPHPSSPQQQQQQPKKEKKNEQRQNNNNNKDAANNENEADETTINSICTSSETELDYDDDDKAIDDNSGSSSTNDSKNNDGENGSSAGSTSISENNQDSGGITGTQVLQDNPSCPDPVLIASPPSQESAGPPRNTVTTTSTMVPTTARDDFGGAALDCYRTRRLLNVVVSKLELEAVIALGGIITTENKNNYLKQQQQKRKRQQQPEEQQEDKQVVEGQHQQGLVQQGYDYGMYNGKLLPKQEEHNKINSTQPVNNKCTTGKTSPRPPSTCSADKQTFDVDSSSSSLRKTKRIRRTTTTSLTSEDDNNTDKSNNNSNNNNGVEGGEFLYPWLFERLECRGLVIPHGGGDAQT